MGFLVFFVGVVVVCRCHCSSLVAVRCLVLLSLVSCDVVVCGCVLCVAFVGCCVVVCCRCSLSLFVCVRRCCLSFFFVFIVLFVLFVVCE